jgi:hypothetical protein
MQDYNEIQQYSLETLGGNSGVDFRFRFIKKMIEIIMLVLASITLYVAFILIWSISTIIPVC